MFRIGKVESIRSVDFNGTPLYSIQLEGDNTWYRVGKANPEEIGMSAGQQVKFTERNAQVELDSVSVLNGAGTDSSGATAQPVIKPGQMIMEDDTCSLVQPRLDETARRIQWQNARRDAVSIITAAIAVETVDKAGILPWAANTAKAKKLDLLRGYINELATQFIEDEKNG